MSLLITKCLKHIPKVSNDITNYFSDVIEFKQQDSLFYYVPSEILPSHYIASFDIDWTVTFSQNKLFPKDEDDIFIIPHRYKTIKKLFKAGYTIAFFTNQYAVSKKEKQKKVARITTFLKKLKIPSFAFIATEKDEYRKYDSEKKIGGIKMWEKFTEFVPSIKHAFFVGDAGGREQDFSDSDKNFADMIGIPWYSPEDFFPKDKEIKFSGDKNMVVFVGMSGSGKTTYYKRHLEPLQYVHANQDTLKTKARVLKFVKKAIVDQKSIVIDATNPSQEKRQIWYDLAKENDYSVTLIYFIKDGRGWNELREKRVPAIVYHIYFKHLVPPTPENTPGDLYLLT